MFISTCVPRKLVYWIKHDEEAVCVAPLKFLTKQKFQNNFQVVLLVQVLSVNSTVLSSIFTFPFMRKNIHTLGENL